MISCGIVKGNIQRRALVAIGLAIGICSLMKFLAKDDIEHCQTMESRRLLSSNVVYVC
jgi:hypothetical protein